MAVLSSQRPGRPRGSIPTSSMADIAFLLLVFFLVTTVFDEEKGLSLVLPEDRPVPVSPGNVLHLWVVEDGGVEVKRGDSPRVQRVRAADIGAIWRTEVRDRPELIAAVKTAPGARYGAMVDVLDQLQAVGAERVNLGVLEDR